MASSHKMWMLTEPSTLVAIAKRLGAVKTLATLLALAWTIVTLLGLVRFFFDCVLLIGSGCEL